MQLIKYWNENRKKEQSDERQKMLLCNLITLRVFLKRVMKLIGFERVTVSSLLFEIIVRFA
jgi:hypothetical protein